VNGNTTGGSNNSYCLQRTGLGNIMSFNNIFVNKRSTNGTGFNYATGSNSLTGITPTSTNYNLYLVNDTLRVNEGPLNFANSVSVFNSLYTNANTYSSNWYALNNAVPTQTLFIDTLIGNLGIVTSNPNSWYTHGKGLALAAVNNDYNNATRSTAIATGATDIGSVEFTTTTLPIAATASAAPALNTTTNYTFAGRNIASITWGAMGTVPSAVNVVYYSGINAPNLIASRTQYNAYAAITPTGGSGYAYGIALIVDSATFGNVTSSNESRIARYAGTNWNLISNSTANGIIGFLQTATNTQSVFGNFTGTSNANPLPVNLLTFTAKAVEEDVLVTWQIASETNNKGFEVERSVDGLNFETIGFVKGKGNSEMVISYGFVDQNAFENAGINKLFYRLNQVDFDGTSSYSTLKQVEKEVSFGLNVWLYPNPFVQSFTIALNLVQTETIAIEVLDVNGRGLNRFVKSAQEAVTITELDELASGVYFIRVSIGDELKVLKLVKE